jgi:hypothetical protein
MKWIWALMMASGLVFMVYQLFWWEKPEGCPKYWFEEQAEGVKCP